MPSSNLATNVSSSVAKAASTAQTNLGVRVGYFCSCVSDPISKTMLCDRKVALTLIPKQDPLDLIGLGEAFRTDVIFPYLA